MVKVVISKLCQNEKQISIVLLKVNMTIELLFNELVNILGLFI